MAAVRPSALAAFLVGSFVAHGVAYAALSSLPQDGGPQARPIEVEFTVFEPTPAPEPVVAPEPPVAPQPPVVRARRVEPKPVLPATSEAPQAQPEAAEVIDPAPAPLALGVSSDTGLAVAGVVAARASNGNGTGTGTGVGPAVAKIDIRPIAKAWSNKVGLVINARASRDYPRSAVRANLQGTVLLAVSVDVHGRLSRVEIKKSSGHSRLDEAALAAARGLGDLPAPPELLHRWLAPLTVPITYRTH